MLSFWESEKKPKLICKLNLHNFSGVWQARFQFKGVLRSKKNEIYSLFKI